MQRDGGYGGGAEIGLEGCTHSQLNTRRGQIVALGLPAGHQVHPPGVMLRRYVPFCGTRDRGSKCQPQAINPYWEQEGHQSRQGGRKGKGD